MVDDALFLRGLRERSMALSELAESLDASLVDRESLSSLSPDRRLPLIKWQHLVRSARDALAILAVVEGGMAELFEPIEEEE